MQRKMSCCSLVLGIQLPGIQEKSDIIRTAKYELRIYRDTFIDLGGWLGVPPVECRERALIERS